MTPLLIEYHLTFQGDAGGADPRATIELSGTNFSDLCATAQAMGYPRIISGAQRHISEWGPVDYPWDEATA